MHAAAVLSERRVMMIHGGKAGDRDIRDDVCLLDLDKWVWAKALTSPHRRVGHAFALLPPLSPSDPSTIVILGGFSGHNFANDASACEIGATGKLQWSSLPAGGWDERFAACAAPLGERIFIFGGSAAAGELNDLWML